MDYRCFSQRERYILLYKGASNYSEIFSDNNGRGTLCTSDIGNKWKANVSVARMNDVHILREMIEI